MESKFAEFQELQELALLGGGEKYIQRHRERGKLLARERGERLGALAAALADQGVERERASVMKSVPSGWRNSRS